MISNVVETKVLNFFSQRSCLNEFWHISNLYYLSHFMKHCKVVKIVITPSYVPLEKKEEHFCFFIFESWRNKSTLIFSSNGHMKELRPNLNINYISLIMKIYNIYKIVIAPSYEPSEKS